MRAFLAALLLALPLAAADLAVNLSGTTGPDFGNRLNSSDVEVARFVLQATGGDVEVDSITFELTNHVAAAVALTRLRLFYDANGNGSFEVNEEIDATATIAPDGVNATVTFSGEIGDVTPVPLNIVSGPSRLLQLRVNISNDPAAYGEAFRFSIPTGGVTLVDVGDTISGSLPAQSNILTIRHSENQLVPGTGNPTGPRTVFYGATNVGALHFIVASLNATPPGQLIGIDVHSITILITMANASQTSAVSRLSLWQDDGDSLFEPNSGEVLIQQRVPTDITKWSVAGNVISVTFDGTAIENLADIPTGGARPFWVGIDFTGGLDAVCEVTVSRLGIIGSLGAAADFFVVTPSLISGDVLTLTAPPPPPPRRGPEGEGGCSTGDTSESVWLLIALVVCGLPVVIRNRKIVCRILARSTWYNDS